MIDTKDSANVADLVAQDKCHYYESAGTPVVRPAKPVAVSEALEEGVAQLPGAVALSTRGWALEDTIGLSEWFCIDSEMSDHDAD